jgi:hypothetical protein
MIALFLWCTLYVQKRSFSLLYLHILIFVLLAYLSGLKWKILRKPFSSNGYPKALIDSCIKRFLDKIYNIKNKVHTCSKKIVYFCLPFTGHYGLQIRSQLSKVLTFAYPHISIRVVFRPSCCLSSFFPLKDKIPIALRSHVVYQFTCQCCSPLYVGQTRRHIHTLISEHMGVSPLTGRERSISTMSGILVHKHMHAQTPSFCFWFQNHIIRHFWVYIMPYGLFQIGRCYLHWNLVDLLYIK